VREATVVIEPPATHNQAGPLRFIRYAFMPNRLRYCGSDDNSTLFDYGLEQVIDPGLDPLLRRFTGALPYLQLIAHSNGIADPFDERVVEAYWVGNSLLDRVEVRQLYDVLLERFGKQLTGRMRSWVLGKAPAGARPHHSFHVFDVHSRVGELEHSLETMDQCRVSSGRVRAVEGAEVIVERQPLLLQEGRLALGPPEPFRAARQVEGRGFVDGVQAGDWVALHWGWVCEVLPEEQQRRLARFTEHHLQLANETI
jgi:hypothetical protein